MPVFILPLEDKEKVISFERHKRRSGDFLEDSSPLDDRHFLPRSGILPLRVKLKISLENKRQLILTIPRDVNCFVSGSIGP